MLFTGEFSFINNYNTKIRGSISFAQQQARNAIECFRTSYKGMKPQEDNPPTNTMRADPQTIHNPSLYILEQKEIARKEKRKVPNVETENDHPTPSTPSAEASIEDKCVVAGSSRSRFDFDRK